MVTVDKLKRMRRGDVSARTVVLEALRRTRVLRARRLERKQLAQLAQPARLCEPFAQMTAPELLAHFQCRVTPQFFPGFAQAAKSAQLQQTRFPNETSELLAQANRISDEHCWPLLGFGEKCFGAGEIDWNLDPLSGFDWPTAYRADIKRNLEFSHIATSNHYLADVTGLLWLGVMLPELAAAPEWREFGLRELLNELEKQILADGADYEASTGYHRLKLELILYSFVLCHLNGIEIAEKYWNRLHGMIEYIRAYLRPDGRAPLIGDSDSGQIMPIVRRAGDDHAYLLALGAAVFQEPRFKLAAAAAPEELLWILGEQGLRDYQSLPHGEPAQSRAFPDAGTFVLSDDDLYLLFNASDSGLNGRGSHCPYDGFSIE